MRHFISSLMMCISLTVVTLSCTNQGKSKASGSPVREEAVADTVKKAVPFAALDEQPLFNGLPANNFVGWVNLQLKYPESLMENKVEGKILLSFVIDENGKMTDVKVIEGICEELDNEAVRAVSSSPDWTPGKKDGETVPAIFRFPIIFKFSSSN